MGPSEVESLLDTDPFVPFRLTLATGQIVTVMHREGTHITGLSLAIEDVSALGRPRLRFVSIPNIVLAEAVPDDERFNRRLTGGD